MKASEVNRSTCEKQFTVNALRRGIRQDGRQLSDYREVSFSYGTSFGHCEVCIGDTRALAQVSCEVIKPRLSRPNEGQLFLNVELSPMASQAFESGRPSDQAIEINRFVERCLRESRTIDMESLCIIAGEKVWCLRVDVHILDDKGNILDCACIAALASLAHFRRPDVTVNGKDVTIHSFDDKEAIPLGVHHMPICISLGFISSCDKIIIDPTEIEELALDGIMTVALNSYMEICCAKMCGVAISPEKVIMCCRIASSKVKEITDRLKKSLEDDKRERFPNKSDRKKWRVGDVAEDIILKSVSESTRLGETDTIRDAVENSNRMNSDPTLLVLEGKKTAMEEGDSSVWIISDDESVDGKDKNTIMDIGEIEKSKRKSNKINHSNTEIIKIDDESEEEETTLLTSMDVDFQVLKESNIGKELIDEDVEIVEKRIEVPRTKLAAKKKRRKRKK